MAGRGRYVRRLTDDEVREIRHLHSERAFSAARIARQLDVSPVTVARVVSRRTYADVVDIEGGTVMCPCVTHTTARRRTVNLGRVRAVAVLVLCVHCGRGVTATAADVQARNGVVVCAHCGGGR